MVVVQPNPLLPDRVEVKKSDIAERRPAKSSAMPDGLLNQFTKEEIWIWLPTWRLLGKKKLPISNRWKQPQNINCPLPQLLQ